MRTRWFERRPVEAGPRRARQVRAIANTIPKTSRDLLVEHLDGGWVHNLVGSGRRHYNLNLARYVEVLCRIGLVEKSAEFPYPTKITEVGREVLSVILADYADLLVRAGALGDRQKTMVEAFLRVMAKPPEKQAELA